MVKSYYCKKTGLKKGTWSPQEDEMLSVCVNRYGTSSWRELPKYAGLKRCGKSCRLRWMNYLRPDIKRGNYTKEEEETIINLHEQLGNRWSTIAEKLPGRTDNEIKNHWHTHLKKRAQRSSTSVNEAKIPTMEWTTYNYNKESPPKTYLHNFEGPSILESSTVLLMTQENTNGIVFSPNATTNGGTSESQVTSGNRENPIEDNNGNFWNGTPLQVPNPYLAENIVSPSDDVKGKTSEIPVIKGNRIETFEEHNGNSWNGSLQVVDIWVRKNVISASIDADGGTNESHVRYGSIEETFEEISENVWNGPLQLTNTYLQENIFSLNGDAKSEIDESQGMKGNTIEKFVELNEKFWSGSLEVKNLFVETNVDSPSIDTKSETNKSHVTGGCTIISPTFDTKSETSKYHLIDGSVVEKFKELHGDFCNYPFLVAEPNNRENLFSSTIAANTRGSQVTANKTNTFQEFSEKSWKNLVEVGENYAGKLTSTLLGPEIVFPPSLIVFMMAMEQTFTETLC